MSSPQRRWCVLFLVSFALCVGRASIKTSEPDEWSRFRGPNGAGIVPDAGYPVEFGPTRSLKWRTPVRPGKSSPVLSRRHVFVTAYDEGKLYTQCFDRTTGALLWERSAVPARREDAHVLNEPAAATPVTDGENVYVFFRDLGVVSYDPAGAVRWKRVMGPFTNRMGAVASPIVAGNVARPRAGPDRPLVDRRAVARDGRGAVGDPAKRDRRLGHAVRLRPDRRLAASGDGRRRAVRRSRARDRTSPLVASGPRARHRRQPGHDRQHARRLRVRLRLHAAVLGCAGQKRSGQGRPAIRRGVWHERVDDRHGEVPGRARRLRRRTGLAGRVGGDDRAVEPRRRCTGPRRIGNHPPARALALREELRRGRAVADRARWARLHDQERRHHDGAERRDRRRREDGARRRRPRVVQRIAGFDRRTNLPGQRGRRGLRAPAGKDWQVLASNDLGEAMYATPALSQGFIFVRAAKSLFSFGGP